MHSIINNLVQMFESGRWQDAAPAWQHHLYQQQSDPAQQPEVLEALVLHCQQEAAFSLWALTLRALAHYNQRQAMFDLWQFATQSKSFGGGAWQLLLAEAQLECGETAVSPTLANIDPQQCSPLPPAIAHLWQEWLQHSFAWWQGTHSAAEIEENLAALLAQDTAADDDFAQGEGHRLHHQIALCAARCSLAQADLPRAAHWLTMSLPAAWETAYLKGLCAWTANELLEAKNHLQQSASQNPFQKRVQFELGLLLVQQGQEKEEGLSLLDKLPDVPEAAATAAMAFYKLGQAEKADQLLSRLDQPPAPHSAMLIWPQTRPLRLRQGYQLGLYLAEQCQAWAEALHWLDKVQALSDMTIEQQLAARTHRLYLQQQLQARDTAVNPPFQKELGKLSIRQLHGEAMYYRSMAAATHMPSQAVADWQALLQDKDWVTANQQSAPQRLLYIGDCLQQVGYPDEAQQAYALAGDDLLLAVQTRQLLLAFVSEQPPERERLLAVLETAVTTAPDELTWHWLQQLCHLVEMPLDEALPTLKGLLDVPLGEAAPTWQLAQATMNDPQGMATLHQWQNTVGTANWTDWCPLSPETIVAWQLKKYCQLGDYESAIHEVELAAQAGLAIPKEWFAYLYAAQAVQYALSGSFDTAIALQQQALQAMESKG